jgi:predicted transcriptional regulator of viral defense system
MPSLLHKTIRHPKTSAAIVAYLAIYPFALKCSRIAGYMEVVHAVSINATRERLSHLSDKGVIIRVRRGWYQSVTGHDSIIG